MTGKDAVAVALKGTGSLLESYLSDLTDADLLVRPAPGANHTAWQLGHLIYSEQFLVKSQIEDARYPELPAGFGEKYTKETSTSDSSQHFATKAVYLDLFKKTREATLAAVAKLSDADLDRSTKGPMAPFAPKLGAYLLLVSNHTLMHGGQFTVVRRKLGKPVLF